MRIFLSYSRQEFHFAESVVLYLQKSGHDVWFDVQRLTPGLDWAQGIQQGLDSAEALILIASRAALASVWVRKEWEQAQQQGKPVYVLLYEWTALPPDLKPQAVFDLRGSFMPAMKKVDTCLKTATPCTQQIQARFWRGPRPSRVTLMSVGLLMNVVIAAAAVLAALFQVNAGKAGWGIFWMLVFVAAGLSTWGNWRKFEARQFQSSDFYVALFLVPVLGMIFPLAMNATAYSNLFLLCFTLGIFDLLFITRSFNIKRYHWMPRGSADDSLREGILLDLDPTPDTRIGCMRLFGRSTNSYDAGKEWLNWVRELDVKNLPVPENAVSIRYSIEAAAADERIVEQLDRTMEHFLHVRVDKDEPADQRFYIVSNHTPRTLLNEANQTATPVTLVLASTVDLADEAATRYQIVDYRSRSQRQLNSIARYFAAPDKHEITEFGLTQIPRPFMWFILPPEIHGLAVGIRSLGAFFTALAVTLTIILAGILPVDPRDILLEMGILGIGMLILLGLIGIASIIGSDLLAERRIRAGVFVPASALFTALVIGMSLFMLLRTGLLPQIGFAILSTIQDGDNVEYIVYAVGMVIGSVIPLTLRARLWLPKVIEALPADQTLRIRSVAFIRDGVRDAVFLTILLLAALAGSAGL